jgi:Holliday junction DNA helicase RuvB
VVDFALVEGDGRVTREIADRALNRLGVDRIGLDGADRRYLKLIAESYLGGPVGWKRYPPPCPRRGTPSRR